MPAGHSPLGASGSHRWLKCPGSVSLSQGMHDESDYAAEGTAAHTLGAYCLEKNHDAWEFIGTWVDPQFGITSDKTLIGDGAFEVTKDMADAVQVYLTWVRQTFPERDQGNTFIERPFHCPTIHDLFYGTCDFAYVNFAERVLDDADYKHGAGIVVEVEDNPQLMYYACGLLEDLKLWDAVDRVRLHIVQPRGFHRDGAVRTWEVTVPELIAWLEDILIPGMNRALVQRDTIAGEHCRFCPARGRACPAIMAAYATMEELMETAAARQLSEEELARFLGSFQMAKIANKAHEEDAFNRLVAGKKVPGWKTVAKKTFREWKEGAEAEVKAKFGNRAYSKPELLSPAQVDKLPEGKALTATWAHKPPGGLTLAPEEDNRQEVSRSTKSMFTPVAKSKAA